jgi:alpha-beta hydrolase superfamily lysophospholipase
MNEKKLSRSRGTEIANAAMGPLTCNQIQFEMPAADGLRIACARWSNRKPPRGLLQIAHGMGEHLGRYETLIEELVHAGLIVYGNDHRGHGRTARSPKELGDFGHGGFNLMVKDMVQLSLKAREEYPNQPFILFGHGMGSFAAQQYVLDHSDLVDGLVLSGSGALDGFARLASGAKPEENFLNASYTPARTPVDWLSRDPAATDAFTGDPLCFGTLQPASMQSFLAAAPQLANSQRLRGIRRALPIYLFSGSEDPVGEQLEGLRILIGRYRSAGLSNISHHFYPGGRHEMLHEVNSQEVRTNLLLWISSVLQW